MKATNTTNTKNKSDKFKGGRPALGIGRKKTYRINLKLDTQEYYALRAKMLQAGIKTKSDFVRECIRNAYVKARLTVEQTDYIRKLCGMANNLNQLAYQANKQGYFSASKESILLTEKIDNLINSIENDG